MAEKAEDLNLPVSVITRLVKESLPPGVIVSKEARTAIARAASVFVLHTTTYANQNATNSKRKTINAIDIIEGVKELELEELIGPLQEAVTAWKTSQKTKADAKKVNKKTNNSQDSENLTDIRLSDSDEGANQ